MLFCNVGVTLEPTRLMSVDGRTVDVATGIGVWHGKGES